MNEWIDVRLKLTVVLYASSEVDRCEVSFRVVVVEFVSALALGCSELAVLQIPTCSIRDDLRVGNLCVTSCLVWVYHDTALILVVTVVV